MERAEATGVTPVRDRRALAASERTIKRRRRFSLEEKRTILKAAGEPGATVAEVARQYGVGRSGIHNWRRQEALAGGGGGGGVTPGGGGPPGRRRGEAGVAGGGRLPQRTVRPVAAG